MQEEIIFTPTEFISSLNQTLEFTYPRIVIEGELANFKVSKNRWVYFDLKDELSNVPFFGTIYQLPGPLEDGLTVRAIGIPRMHPRFGFSVNFQSITPVGEGALKKAADLLLRKLEAEGLFAEERKRLLPYLPEKVGLITAAGSAAASDFVKILNERFGGVEVFLADVYVQGELAPASITSAIEHFNQLSEMPEVLVITRGGGSADDLAAFSDERVVRAVAASRIPTLVAIGHEVDISLSELAADQRASTPSNAAQILVPDKNNELVRLKNTQASLLHKVESLHKAELQHIKHQTASLKMHIDALMANEFERIAANKRLIKIFDPKAALRRGYALVKKEGKYLTSVQDVNEEDRLSIVLVDGTIQARAERIKT